MSSRLTATLIVAFVLAWRAFRTVDTARASGSGYFVFPQARHSNRCEASWEYSRAATIWTYRINDGHDVELVFDRRGTLICKTEYFIAI